MPPPSRALRRAPPPPPALPRGRGRSQVFPRIPPRAEIPSPNSCTGEALSAPAQARSLYPVAKSLWQSAPSARFAPSIAATPVHSPPSAWPRKP